MSLPLREDIGEERHAHVEQLLGVVAGRGRAAVNGKGSRLVAGRRGARAEALAPALWGGAAARGAGGPLRRGVA